MSKKRNKKNNSDRGFARLGGSSAATGGTLKDRDADGFAKLGPKPDGETTFTEFMRRRSKKSDLITTPETPVAYAEYDPGKIMNQLDKAIEAVSKNKFSKAYEALDKVLVDELVDAFRNMDQDLSNAPLVNIAATKLLQVCKTFYEYDEKSREVLPNTVYDGFLAKYTGLGLTEPTGIVPDTGKKTGIVYPELHNNMDKAYILKKGELVPEGVKETDSVEDFLMRAYEAAGMQTNEELTLELSPKIDGVSVNGTIKHGCLVKPQTRGDQDASMAISGLSGIELGPNTDDEFGIQYECFVLDADREKAAAYLGLKKTYVSNRHAAAGIINRLCTDEDDGLLEFLSFYPIEAVDLHGDMSYENRMRFIQSYGCMPDDMIERKTITGSIDSLLKKIQDTFGKFAKKREKLSYSIDGMVITIVDQNVRDALGRKGRTNQYQIGYKFDPANAEAIVKGVFLDTGNKGFRTIQVELEHPVFLDGVRYDHVPVLSAGLFEKMDLHVGSIVNVHRVGDVIPSISVVKAGNGKPLAMRYTCPHCGEPLTIKNKKLYCGNSDCSGNLAGKFLGFFIGIGLDQYGESFTDVIVNHPVLKVSTFSDLLDLDKKRLKEAGIGDKLASEFQERLMNAIRDCPDYVIIGSMGLPDIGPARAKELLKFYGGIDQFLLRLNRDTIVNKFRQAIGVIGEKTGQWITDSDKRFGQFEQDLQVLRACMENITVDFSVKIRVGHTGGELSDEVLDLCEKNDMEAVDGKSFDILITSDKNSDSKKMVAARSKNIPIYTESEFIAKYQR